MFDKPGVLPRLAAAAQTFIPVVFTREVERELAPYAKSMYSIVIYPRNAATNKPRHRSRTGELRDLQQGARRNGQGS